MWFHSYSVESSFGAVHSGLVQLSPDCFEVDEALKVTSQDFRRLTCMRPLPLLHRVSNGGGMILNGLQEMSNGGGMTFILVVWVLRCFSMLRSPSYLVSFGVAARFVE